MDITLYRFSKRSNSTKRPSGSGIGTYACDFIQPTSIHNPSIILYASDLTDVLTANYAKFNNEYFYVSDIVINTRDSVTLQLSKDVLASFKTEIGNTTARILYSSTNYNVMIPDTRIATTSKWEVTQIKSDDSTFTSKKRYYLLQLMGHNATSNVGTTTIALLTQDQMDTLDSVLMTSNFLEGLKQDFTNGISDCLIKCLYYPYNILDFINNAGTSQVSNIRFGTYTPNPPVPGALIFKDYVMPNGKLVINAEDYDLRPYKYNDFRDGSGYTQIRYSHPFCGECEISADLMMQYDTLTEQTIVDPLSGAMYVNLYGMNNEAAIVNSELLATIAGQSAVEIPLGQIQMSPLSAVHSIIGGAIGVVGGALAGGGAGAIIGGTLATANSLQSPTQVIAGGSIQSCVNSERQNFHKYIRIGHRVLGDEPANMATLYGRPNGDFLQIGTLTGYVQTENASISADAPEEEINAVNAALNGGIYYE